MNPISSRKPLLPFPGSVATAGLRAIRPKYRDELNSRINGKKVMRAGTIGSFYIKTILKFNIKRLVVVDINENGLTELVGDVQLNKVGLQPIYN